MEGEGMMAVVRGLRDGLAVTLLDSGRQYTLTPETMTHPVARSQRAAASQCVSTEAARKESAVQATDGRYASTYKMMHCHVKPTSPPVQVTEFPPQRAEVCHGAGNFEIGGTGSGETYCQAAKGNGYRGGLCWTDRGSVFSARPSLQPDAFASSLRKYPSLSRERSSEILEKLISFTQGKHATKSQKSLSPARSVGLEPSSQAFSVTGNSSRHSSATRTLNRSYDAEVTSKSKKLDESPTRDRSRRNQDYEPLESWRRSTFSRTSDINYLREVVKNVRENTRSMSPQPSCPPERLVTRVNHRGDLKSSSAQWSTNSVNMETQAAVEMVSREVVTVPRDIPSLRTVAIPLTPTSSVTGETLDAEVSTETSLEPKVIQITQAVQSFELSHVTLQTAISSVELCVHNHFSDRRSRSQEEVRLNTMETEIKHLLHALQIPSSSKCINRSGKERRDGHLFTNNKYLWNGDKNDERNNSEFENMLDIFKEKKIHQSSYKSCHYKHSLKIINDQDLAHVIHSWLTFIPTQTESVIELELIFRYLFDLFKFYNNKFEIDWKSKLKSSIIEVLDIISIDSINNRRSVLNKLSDMLIEKVKNISKRKRVKRKRSTRTKDLRISSFLRHAPAKEVEIKNIVSKEIKLLLEIFSLKLNKAHINEIESNLSGIFTNLMGMPYFKNDKCIRSSIMQTLHNHGLSEPITFHFTEILMKRLKKAILYIEPTSARLKKMMVYPILHSSKPSVNKDDSLSSKSTEANTNTSLVRYTEELRNEINEWLDSLQIPQIDNDKGLKQVVVHDLAGDIIDRHKYLVLNPASRGSDASELEYLKFQIFKWVNKLVEEHNFKPIEYAPELMRRIQGILQPILSRSRSNEYNNSKILSDLDVSKALSCRNTNCNPMKTLSPYKESSVRFDEKSLSANNKENNSLKNRDKTLKNTTEYADQYTGAFDLIQNQTGKSHENVHCHSAADPAQSSQSQKIHCCPKLKLSANSTPSPEQLNEEYEQFLKNWVQQIPIDSSNPEEEVLADKARLGIHNGIWKAVTKLNCEPAIYSNRFLYEDVLDDEVEDLINCLPQTPNLIAKKHLLKVKLLEKTANTIEKMYATENASFKNKLIQNIANVIRTHKVSENGDESSDKFNQDLLIMKLVEEYILSVKYKDEDKVIAETYKNQLQKQIEQLFENLKKTEGNKIQQINLGAYKTDIIQSLQNVPLPNEDVVKEAADDVLLGFEIEEWISDLPIILSEDYIEQYHRKKLRDSLVKNIREMENMNLTGDIPQSDLQNLIMKFIEKVSIKEGESINFDFVISELTNRIRNRQKANTSQTTKRVAFIEPQGYEEFRNDVPFSSSLIKTPVLTQNYSTSQENSNTLKSNSTQCRLSCGRDNVDEPIMVTNNKASLPTNTHQSCDQQCREIFDDKTQQNLTANEMEDCNWYTLHDDMIPTKSIKKDIDTQSSHFHACNAGKDQSFEKHQGTQRNTNKSLEPHTDKEILEKNPRYCKSDFNTKNITENCPKNCSTHITPMSEYKDTGKINDINKVCCASNDYYPKPIFNENQLAPSNTTSNSFCSAGCQTGGNIHRNQSQSSVFSSKTNDKSGQRNVGTAPSFDNFVACQEAQCNSTPKNNISHIRSQGANKRRAKLTITEKDAARNRIDVNGSEEDDEIRCHCIERSWKSMRRPKYYLCDDYENYPQLLPVFYPYPCFL